MVHLLIGALIGVLLVYLPRYCLHEHMLKEAAITIVVALIGIFVVHGLIRYLHEEAIIKHNEALLATIGLIAGTLLTAVLPFTVTPMARSGRLSR